MSAETLILEAPILAPLRSRSPSPTRLPSDDEGTPDVIPPTLRTLPTYFPSLPPKHTYLRTPVCRFSSSFYSPLTNHSFTKGLPTKESCYTLTREKTQDRRAGAGVPQKFNAGDRGPGGAGGRGAIGTYRELGNERAT